jgi:ADP-heptose:LPS heptosyltransferase
MRGNRLHRSLDTYLGRAGIRLLAPFSRRGRDAELPPPDRVRRILVVKLSALGDTVLLVPALRALRERYPAAEIGMVGTRLNRDLMAEFPRYVDRFLCLDVGRATRSPRYLAGFVADLRAGGWEVGIDFDQWPHIPPLLLRLAGIPVRIGFRHAAGGRHLLYTHTRPRLRESHEAENFLRLLSPLFPPPAEPVLELPVREELVPQVLAGLSRAGWNGTDPLVVVHPGCGHAHPRAWPLASYRELCVQLARAERAFFVFTGAGSEQALAEDLAAALPGRSCARTRMSIPEFIACLSVSTLVVSGNTGAMHLAAALGLPQVVLEGPNDPAKWGPLNADATIVRSSCPGCPCLDFGWEFHRTDGFCMAQIPVREVYDAVAAELRRTRRVARAAGS